VKLASPPDLESVLVSPYSNIDDLLEGTYALKERRFR
jgi:hypothetical protein